MENQDFKQQARAILEEMDRLSELDYILLLHDHLEDEEYSGDVEELLEIHSKYFYTLLDCDETDALDELAEQGVMILYTDDGYAVVYH